jgi:excisionase family DNA binding protein
MSLLRSPHTNEDTERLLSVAEVAEELGLSRTTGYDLLWSGEIPSLKIGRRRLVRRRDLLDYIQARLEQAGG